MEEYNEQERIKDEIKSLKEENKNLMIKLAEDKDNKEYKQRLEAIKKELVAHQTSLQLAEISEERGDKYVK